MTYVEARYLIQYIHFAFHRFCDDKSSRGIATVFNYRPATWLYVAGSGSSVKLPPVLAAHAGNIESIVAQITLTMCLLRSQKNFNSVSTVLYSSISTMHNFKQIHILNCLITLTILLTMGLLCSQKRV